jgi:hypothetical protein
MEVRTFEERGDAMKRLTTLALLVSPLLMACWGVVGEELSTIDTVALLAQKGVGEEVLLAYVERIPGEIAISVDQLIKLKETGVSEKVLAAILNKRSVPARQPEAQVVSQPLQPIYQYTPPTTRVVNREDLISADEAATTVVYEPSYVSPYSYPYYSPYYRFGGAPWSLSIWGGSWGWGGWGGCRPWGYGGYHGYHHGGGHRR